MKHENSTLIFTEIFGTSIDKTVEQADEYGHSFERELGFLVVHGLLHLNGYDHMTETDEKEMFALQERILKEYGLER
ncbi:MAG: rRNA maturation RNase YbeY [Bacillus sp. (in: Bacteria)]|nr:rRNA maturation RNase YbeY [Bacillus sp. (in: firmicutes)]